MSSFFLVDSLRIQGANPGSPTGRAYHKRTYESQKLAECSRLRPPHAALVKFKLDSCRIVTLISHKTVESEVEGMKVMY